MSVTAAAQTFRARRCSAFCLLALGLCGCGFEPPDLRMAWDPVVGTNATLPAGVRLFAAEDPSIPLRAWHVRVDEHDANLSTRVAVSTDADGRETITELARRTGAVVAVNGGYFRRDREPAAHVGLLLVGGRLLQPPLDSVIRDRQRYYLARAAFGVMADGSIDIAWVSGRGGVLYSWDEPPPNASGHPGPEPTVDDLPVWDAMDAVAAGPVLLVGGEVRISSQDEVFFGTSILDVHPRTAAGITGNGDLILLVVDGRQRDSRGVGLKELATLLRDLGCVEALNLDGGGSSQLVVDGSLVNTPLGGAEEREVMSALTVLAE